jgi:hypothetical protein
MSLLVPSRYPIISTSGSELIITANGGLIMKYFYYLSGNISKWLLPVITAGLAGGLIEITWISLYSLYSPVNATEVARQISVSIIPATADFYFAPMLGVFAHLLLSVGLACVFAATALLPFLRRYGRRGIFLGSLATLAVVWKINFFTVLPMINPSFTSMMPFYVTLLSKLLFGTAMAWVLAVRLPSLEVASSDVG